MPYLGLTKANWRDALAFRMGSKPYTFSTSGAGSSVQAVASSMANFGDGFFDDWFLLVETGAESVKWRAIALATPPAYVSSTGAFNVLPALAGAPGASVTCSVHIFNPALYTLAYNRAKNLAFPGVSYPIRNWGGLIAVADQYQYPLPRGIVRANRVLSERVDSRVYYDLFTRANSALLAGTATSGATYTAQTGLGGISSNKLYFPNDADLDLITTDPAIKDGYFQAMLEGTLNHATVYRCPDLVFHFLDTSNYLAVRLRNALVELIKRDGGTDTVLASAVQTTTNAVQYVTRVQYLGSRISVWVDEVELIQYELQGTDLKYIAYTPIGFRLSKAGAPATNARIDDAKFHKWVRAEDRHDWLQSPGQNILLFGQTGEALQPFVSDRVIIVEGRRYLTALADDTTTGTLASDAVATIELAIDSQEWEVLLAYGKAAMYELLTNPQYTEEAQKREEYKTLAKEALVAALGIAGGQSMPQFVPTLRSPYTPDSTISQSIAY